MKSQAEKLAQLFTFLLLLGLTTSIISTAEIEIYEHEPSPDDSSSLVALWMETEIGGETINMQIGMAILAVMLFISIFSIIVYSKEDRK